MIEGVPLEKRIYDGARAREVLDNEAYQQAFADLKSEIKDKWEHSPSRDAEGREKLYLMLGLLAKLEGILQTSMETGRLAELELSHKQTLADRARALLGGS